MPLFECSGGMRTRGLSVMVTGASSGIGRETATALAGRGARVFAVARSADLLYDLAGGHERITSLPADLTDDAERAAVVEAVGDIDVLVNNAGIGWVGQVEEMPPAQVRQLFELNVLALIDLTQRVIPGMLERGRGHVVNVASVASWVALPPLTVYSATKFAVQGFSEGLRREMSGRGVTVATINPGPVATRFGPRAQSGNRASQHMDGALMAGVPASLVARAVVRSVHMAGWPGYSAIAVPRVVGLSRLGAVPGLRWMVDAAALVTRRPETYRRFGDS
ncbi:MAG TPA: SDR family NAD(P)-dependent oxidoreductase [Acidimicrobiales bacterium]|nr:SDR family NAD(P)-dependent oxidoreductase [Acidimicrobiales bacterium]